MSVPTDYRRFLAPTIVGRDAVLARLDRAFDVAARSGCVVQVAGDAGLGKTRLVTALVERADAERRPVLAGRCQPSDWQFPLAVFQEALRANRRAGREIAPREPDQLAASFPAMVLPELGGPSDMGDRGLLFEAAVAYVRAFSSGSGVVVVLEDLHWSDPTSLALIPYLVRASADCPLLVLLTYRLGGSPSVELDGLRRALVRERAGEEIVLLPLDAAGVRTMLAGILGESPDPRLVQAVTTASGGNPFAVEELVRHEVAAGRLDPGTGAWSVGAPLALPWTVTELVLEGVRRLSDLDQEILCWAAVIGPEANPRLLAEASGREEPMVVAALARLRDAGLVTENLEGGPNGTFRIRHDLTREAVVGTLLRAELRDRHARVLLLLEAQGDEEAPIEALARHAFAAGDRRAAFRYSSRAARRSLEMAGYVEADIHFERALDLWRADDGREAQAALLLDYGRLLARVSRDPRAAGFLAEASAAHRALGRRVDAARARAAAAGARWSSGIRDGVLEEFTAARAELQADDPLEAHLEVLPGLARALWMRGDLTAAREVALEGLVLARRATTRDQRLAGIHLRTTLGSTLWLLGRTEQGDQALQEALRSAEEEGDELGRIRACSDLAFWHLNRTAASALGYADHGIVLAERRELHLPLAWLRGARSLVLLKAGDWRGAEGELGAAELELEHVGPDPDVRLNLRWARGEWELAARSPDCAISTLAAAAPEADALGDLQLVMRVRRSLARAHLADDDPEAAASAVRPALDRWDVSRPTPIRLLVTAAEIAACSGDAAATGEVARALADRAPLARVRYGLALAALAAGRSPAPGLIADAVGEVEADGWRLEAARLGLTAAEALARFAPRNEQAVELGWQAQSAFTALELDAWGERCESLLRRLGAQRPMRRGGAGGLSRREVEVVRLLADGRSNRAIADALVISERTAERHVANIFTKLAVHSRTEAIRVAGERGLLRDHAT